MAEEFRHAGIGIDLNIDGLQKLAELNQRIDKTINGLKTVGDFAEKADGSIDKMANNSSHKLSGLTDDFNKVRSANEQVINKVKDIQQSINNIHNQNINDLSQSFKNVNSSSNNAMKAIGNVKKIANEISSERISKLGESARKTGRDTEESTHKLSRFRDTALGVFAGNAITNGISGIGHGLLDATKQGLQLNAAMGDIQKRWNQAGLDASQSNAMTEQIASIRQHADISAQAITNMQKQYLTLTGSASQARDLVNTITSFGKASGMTEQQQSGITRLISSNKAVNARMFQRTFGQSPEFANEIIKQTGMTQASFNDLLRSGKITGEQLRNAMIKASKDSSMAWSDYAKTAQGKMDLVNATINTTKVNFEKGLTGSMFEQINSIAGRSGGLDKLQKRVETISKTVGTTIGNVIGGVVSFLVKNIEPIQQMAGAVWSIVKGLASGAWQAVTAPLKMIAGNSKKGSKGLQRMADMLTAIGKHQTILKTIGGLLVGIFAFSRIAKTVIFINKFVEALKSLKLITLAVSAATKAWSAITKVFTAAQWALNVALDANPIGLITLGISGLIIALVSAYKYFKPFRDVVNSTFKSISKVVGGFAKTFKNKFSNVIKGGVKIAKQSFKVIGDAIRVFKDLFTGNFRDLGKVIPKLSGDLWKLVKSTFKGGADFVEDIGSNMWKSIWGTFKSWGKAIGNFFGDLWKGIKNTIKSGINDVIGVINDGIKGVNWVLSKVGGSGHTIGTIKKLASGTMGGRLTRHTMAMLNDGNDSPETGNKEMAILPNGRAFIPQKRNWVGMLPKGTAVLNATETKIYMMMRGIRKFAGGTGFLGGLINGAKKVASAIAHPIKFISSLFHGIGNTSEFITNFTGGLANKAKDSLVSWFKRFGGSSANNPGGSGVNRWRSVIEQAASFMKVALNSSDMSLILGRIAKESGGNPTITQQISDINSKAGHPAQGLLQYVPSTFASWAVKGHTNLLNGYDQLLAMFNDSNWRRDIANAGGWGPTGSRARRNGGQVNKGHWYTVNEEGQELFKPATSGSVINHNDSKRIVNNANKPITINAPLNVTINGGADSKDLDKKLHDSYEQHTRQLAEKMQQEFGMTNDGGYFAI